MLKVLLVDDHPLVLRGLRLVLLDEFEPVQIGEAGDSQAAWEKLVAVSWDVVVLDISLPGRNGLELLQDLKFRWPDLPVLMLSMHLNQVYVGRALSAGASGYLTKESAPEEMASAIQAALAGRTYISKSVREIVVSGA
jgi:DNA-binding NarL/FixJ family response regulator